MEALAGRLPGKAVVGTAELGIDPDWVEAIAFAWLARRWVQRQPGNLPAVTGAGAPRVLGACYPA
jgi:anhydro-N-acetylmuramic acid kinase